MICMGWTEFFFRTDGRMDGWMEGRMEGRTHRSTYRGGAHLKSALTTEQTKSVELFRLDSVPLGKLHS